MANSSVTCAVEKKQAVIFDLFHTLTSLEGVWDGRPWAYQILGFSHEAWIKQVFSQTEDRLKGRLTDPFAIVADIARKLDPALPDEVIQRAVENRTAQFRAALSQMPELTRTVLQTLKARGQRIGLISNADMLEAAPWESCPVRGLFDAAVFSCHVGHMKPEAEIYRIALRRLGVAPGDSIFVGDGGSRELEGARRVGMTTVQTTAMLRGLDPAALAQRRQHADFVIGALSELIEA